MPKRNASRRLAFNDVLSRVRGDLAASANGQFALAVWGLMWEYKVYALAILAVTVLQETAALWPVSLLGSFVDRLEGGDLGHVVWLLLGATVLAPTIARANVMLRHKVFYETDMEKRIEMTLSIRERGGCADGESAGAANARVANAVSGITNAAYHILGSFTPVIIKIVIVSGRLLVYGRVLGLTYLASLIVPMLLTIFFNKWLRVLRDGHYSIVNKVEGLVIRTLTSLQNAEAEQRFRAIMRQRKDIFIALINKHQLSLLARQVALVGSQFLVVFIALAMRARLGLTPGDFTRIIGYTAQVAAGFLEAAACLDAIISYSRAYHVYAKENALLR
jgi:hypothetical protein